MFGTILQEFILQVLLPLVAAVALPLLSVGVARLNKKAKLGLKQAQEDRLTEIVTTNVLAVANAFADKPGSEKFDRAMDKIELDLRTDGIKFVKRVVGDRIEAALESIKDYKHINPATSSPTE